jgi:hypothetical protein
MFLSLRRVFQFSLSGKLARFRFTYRCLFYKTKTNVLRD